MIGPWVEEAGQQVAGCGVLDDRTLVAPEVGRDAVQGHARVVGGGHQLDEGLHGVESGLAAGDDGHAARAAGVHVPDAVIDQAQAIRAEGLVLVPGARHRVAPESQHVIAVVGLGLDDKVFAGARVKLPGLIGVVCVHAAVASLALPAAQLARDDALVGGAGRRW